LGSFIYYLRVILNEREKSLHSIALLHLKLLNALSVPDALVLATIYQQYFFDQNALKDYG